MKWEEKKELFRAEMSQNSRIAREINNQVAGDTIAFGCLQTNIVIYSLTFAYLSGIILAGSVSINVAGRSGAERSKELAELQSLIFLR